MLKVGIARQQGELMLNGERGNPEVVIGDGAPFARSAAFFNDSFHLIQLCR